MHKWLALPFLNGITGVAAVMRRDLARLAHVFREVPMPIFPIGSASANASHSAE